MSNLPPATAGFLPVHLYEGPDLERAQRIVESIDSFCLAAMGLDNAKPGCLRDISLREMLDAVALVEQWNDRPMQNGLTHSIAVVPDDRLTSAVYTLLHFAPMSAFPDSDDDEIPVLFTRGGNTFFLLVGGRKSTADAAKEDARDEVAA